MRDLHTLVWSKADPAGDDLTPGYFVVDGDPNERLEASTGSLAVNPANRQLYVKTGEDATSWEETGGVPASSTGRLIGFQKLSGAGTYTPTAGTNAIYAILIGGGGGTGGIQDSGAAVQAGSGAGAGAVVQTYLSPVAASYTFSVGAAGVGGAAGNNNGTSGGNTTFTDGVNPTLTASGGIRTLGIAAAATLNTPGTGGATATNGNVSNAEGFPGVLGSPATVPAVSGNGGGTSPYGQGGRIRTADSNGFSGTGIGSGGGGALNRVAGGADRAGGNGSAGAILIWEYS